MANKTMVLSIRAEAFDSAATRCATKEHAALAILKQLEGHGYKIVEK
jgi:hypothetical protein